MELKIQELFEATTRARQDATLLKRVWRIIGPKLRKRVVKGSRQLSAMDVDRLSQSIVRSHNLTAIARWEHLDAFNHILYKLKKAGLLESPYANVPIQRRRSLVIPLDVVIRNPLAFQSVRQLRKAVVKGRVPMPPEKGWDKGPALWYFCGTVAAALFANAILVRNLPRLLATCRVQDLRLPGWMFFRQTVWDKRSRARRRTLPEPGIRFPLAPATSRWLKKLLGVIPGNAADTVNLFPIHWRGHEWISIVFLPAWQQFQKALGIVPISSTPSRSLCDEQLFAALIAVLEGIPPFVVSWAKGEMAARPMTLQSYRRLFTKTGESWSGIPWRTMPEASRTHVEEWHGTKRGRAHDLFSRIEAQRFKLQRDMEKTAARKARKQRASEIRNLLRKLPVSPPSCEASRSNILASNARYYGEWLISMLEGGRKLGTVLTHASGVGAVFPYLFSDVPLHQWKARHWHLTVREALKDHETDGIKWGFRSFVSYLETHHNLRSERIHWNNYWFSRPRVLTPIPLIGWEDFVRSLSACDDLRVRDTVKQYVRMHMMLGFLAGLRSSEATRLQVCHFHGESVLVLGIQATKTQAGIRNLYLRQLIPDYDLHQNYCHDIQSWWLERREESPTAYWFPNEAYAQRQATGQRLRGQPYYNSSDLASLAGQAMRAAIREPVCFHHLRHAFGSWFLLRWLVVAGIVEFNPRQYAWQRSPLFNPLHLKEFGKLFFGRDFAGESFGDLLYETSAESQSGQPEFSHALMVLARLLGHGNPRTTLSTYCHTTDVILQLLLRRRENDPDGIKTWTDAYRQFRSSGKASSVPTGETGT